MQLTAALANAIFDGRKRLVAPFEWRPNARNGQDHHLFECRVEMGGGIRQGIIFRIVTYPRGLESYTYQLECENQDTRSNIPLYRLDLKPIKAHVNMLFGSDEVNGLYFEAGVTHEHDFRDSLTADGQLRSNSCVQARLVADPPQDFATALVRVCSRINVINSGDVPLPPSQGSLF
jgi:hypothetical protein